MKRMVVFLASVGLILWALLASAEDLTKKGPEYWKGTWIFIGKMYIAGRGSDGPLVGKQTYDEGVFPRIHGVDIKVVQQTDSCTAKCLKNYRDCLERYGTAGWVSCWERLQECLKDCK